MSVIIRRFFSTEVDLIKEWSHNNIIGLFIFNILIVLQLLLYSAGYFAPYFPLTINMIVLFSLIAAVVLFKMNSKAVFVFALLFWLFAALLMLLGINVWAERTVIYNYEALVVGFFLLLYESRWKK